MILQQSLRLKRIITGVRLAKIYGVETKVFNQTVKWILDGFLGITIATGFDHSERSTPSA